MVGAPAFISDGLVRQRRFAMLLLGLLWLSVALALAGIDRGNVIDEWTPATLAVAAIVAAIFLAGVTDFPFRLLLKRKAQTDTGTEIHASARPRIKSTFALLGLALIAGWASTRLLESAVGLLPGETRWIAGRIADVRSSRAVGCRTAIDFWRYDRKETIHFCVRTISGRELPGPPAKANAIVCLRQHITNVGTSLEEIRPIEPDKLPWGYEDDERVCASLR